MINMKLSNRLTFNNNIVFTDEIHPIDRLHRLAVISRMKRQFTAKRYPHLSQLHLHTFLVAIFTQPGSQFLMNLMNGPYHIVNMRLIFFYVK